MSGSQFFFFFFNDTATTEIYTLSLHDALPIYPAQWAWGLRFLGACNAHASAEGTRALLADRKSTRLNSSHLVISYAVFCLKKKNIYNLKTASHTSALTSRFSLLHNRPPACPSR